MTAPPPLESYELYVLKDGQWQIHSRFDADERKDAIREAKRLAALPEFQAVKVVRDDLAPDGGMSREQTIFKLYRLEGTFAKAADRVAAEQQQGGRSTARPRRGTGRLAAAAAVALAAGTAGAGALYVFPELAERLPQEFTELPRETLAGAAFAVLFVLVIATVAAFAPRPRHSRQQPSSAPAPASPPGEAEGRESHALPQARPQESRPKPPPPAAPPKVLPSPRPAASPPPPAARPQTTPYAEKQVVVATRFVARLLRDAETGIESPHMARGIDLFMAGAVSELGRLRSLPLEEERRILREVLQLVGRRLRQAQGFIDSIEHEVARYPLAPDMMNAGRQAMTAFLGGANGIAAGLATALAEWRGDSSGDRPRDSVTFLFVDVAPFADPGQIRDQVLMQNALNVRDRLFRAAVEEFGGTEIRQTLRGLMAAFPDARNGIDAAVRMHREAVAHTQANADLPVHLQSGLDCGDTGDDERRVPDAAETAAWICRKAQRDQILVSAAVRQSGPSLPFKEAGTLARDNLYDAIPLFEVVWNAAGNLKALETAN